MKKQISPSIMCVSWFELKETIKAFEENGYAADFYFLKDEVPSFVLEELPRDAAPGKNGINYNKKKYH